MCEKYIMLDKDINRHSVLSRKVALGFLGKSKAPFSLSHLLKTCFTPFFHLTLMGSLLFHHHHLEQLLSYLVEHRRMSSGGSRVLIMLNNTWTTHFLRKRDGRAHQWRKNMADGGLEGWIVRWMVAGCDGTVTNLSSGHCWTLEAPICLWRVKGADTETAHKKG